MIFTKAQYLENETIEFNTQTDFTNPVITVYRLEKNIAVSVSSNDNLYTIPALPVGGYGVTVTEGKLREEGAFDVVASSKDIVRYGFLSEFSPSENDTADIEWMKNLHINAVQFYDWMYKHDDLIANEDNYADPLGRETSLTSISGKAAKCKEFGMRPFAYGAVYAATKETYEKHPDWCLYTRSGKPMTFADWLYFMNISKDNGWRKHIVSEFGKAIDFGFEGIHMDTYGFPKHVADVNGKNVDLQNEFPSLIDESAETVRNKNANGGVIFNAVNNWPIESVAGSDQDSAYIEVWPPHDTYFDLYTLIREARLMSKRNVILAAYLNAFKGGDTLPAERSFYLTFATICASGGTQLVLGENKCLLSDSYYVKHTPIKDGFAKKVQKYCDYLVRYNELLYNDFGMDISKTASGGINEDVIFSSDKASFSVNAANDSIWTIIRESSSLLSINLINLLGIDNRWNDPKPEPSAAKNIKIRIRLDRDIKGFFIASPDSDSIAPVQLAHSISYTDQGRIYEVTVPKLHYWSTVWAHLEE